MSCYVVTCVIVATFGMIRLVMLRYIILCLSYYVMFVLLRLVLLCYTLLYVLRHSVSCSLCYDLWCYYFMLMLGLVMLCYTVLRRIILCYGLWCYAVLCYFVLPYVTFCDLMLNCVTSDYLCLCYGLWWYAILWRHIMLGVVEVILGGLVVLRYALHTTLHDDMSGSVTWCPC